MNGTGRIPARTTVSWAWFWVVYAVGPGLASLAYGAWTLQSTAPSSGLAALVALVAMAALYGQFLAAGLTCMLAVLLADGDRRRPEFLLLLLYWVAAGWFALAGDVELLDRAHTCLAVALAIPVVAFARWCGRRLGA
ncbi:MAG: hypothetical protein AB7O97_08630 [Planctomycetota bacterium]